MSKANLKNALSNVIKRKLKTTFDKNSYQEIKEKLENYLPKSYNALKEMYNIKKTENNGKDLNLAKKIKKYILSKIPESNKNEIIEDYLLINGNNNDTNDNDNNNEVSFDINNNKVLINDIVYQITPLGTTNNTSENIEDSDNKVINNISEESLKTVINNIDAPEQIISVVRLGFEIKTIYNTILDSSELISNEKQNNSELDNKINEILELCLMIIDTCQIAVDSEQQDNIELIDNISTMINDLNNELTYIRQYIEINEYAQDNVSVNEFLKIIINLSNISSNIIKNF